MTGSGQMKREVESLLAGKIITKEIFTTGYLTQRGKTDGGHFCLAISNMEIRSIFTTQIMEFFKETVLKDGETLDCFCDALQNGDAEKVEKC